MNNPRKEVDMGFTKDRFPEGTHMCLIYDDDEQRKKIIGQFLAKGISIGEQVGYYADTTTPKDVETWLKDMDIVLPRKKKDGELGVFKAQDIYCPSGGTLLNVLKVHPLMIVRGKIVRNPYYMSPQEFLKDFISRQ